MKTLREIARLAEAGQLATDNRVAAGMRRIILPAGSDVEMSGLFSVSRSQPLSYYLGRVPESVAFIQWPLPPTLARSLLLEETVSKDIVALLSFVSQRRIVVADEVRVAIHGAPSTTFVPTAHKVDSRLYAPIRIGPDVVWMTLRRILSITDAEQFDSITNAMRLYHSATVVGEVDYSAAYLLLVSSMESLAATFEGSTAKFDEWSEAPRWNKWINEVGLDEDIANKLRSTLIDNNRVRLRQRFIALGLKAATEEFWKLPWESSEPEVVIDPRSGSRMRGMKAEERNDITPAKIRKERLRRLLANVYDHRSALVHAGSPFPFTASLDLPTEIEFETESFSAKKTKVALPSFSWFERLVWFAISHCLEAAEKDETYQLPDIVVSPAQF